MMMSDLRLILPGGETIVASEQIMPDATTTAIVLHGFFSNRQSLNAKAAVDGFVQHGMNVIAPDFYGRGDSDGAFGDLTVAKAVETVASVIAHIRQTDPAQKIILTGGSFGGLVAMHVTAQFRNDIKLLILRAPVSDWKAVWDKDLTPQQFAQWDRDGSFTAPMPWGQTVTFCRALYDEMMQGTVYADIAPAISIPTLIVHGTADDVVPLEQSERLNNIIKNSDLIILDGADHGFENPDHLAAYQAAIVTFLAAQQT